MYFISCIYERNSRTVRKTRGRTECSGG